MQLKEFELEEEEEDKSQNLVEFYINCLEERGPMNVEQLFHLSSTIKNELSFKSFLDLKSFFQIQRKCFVVRYIFFENNSKFKGN